MKRGLVLIGGLLLAGLCLWALLDAPAPAPTRGRSVRESRTQAHPGGGDRIGSPSREALREILRRADARSAMPSAERRGEH